MKLDSEILVNEVGEFERRSSKSVERRWDVIFEILAEIQYLTKYKSSFINK